MVIDPTSQEVLSGKKAALSFVDLLTGAPDTLNRAGFAGGCLV